MLSHVAVSAKLKSTVRALGAPLVFLLLLSSCSSGERHNATATAVTTTVNPTASPPEEHSPTAATSSPIASKLIVNGREVPLAEAKLVGPSESARNLSLVVTSGCSACRDVSVDRLTWGNDGKFTSETLLSVHAYNGSYLTGVASNTSGSVIVAGVCLVTDCGSIGAAFNPEARVMLLRSTDGGVTWSELITEPGFAQPIGVTEDAGEAIVQRRDASGSFVAKLPSEERYSIPPSVAGRPEFPWVIGGQPWWKPTAAGRTLYGSDRDWTPDVPEGSALVGIIYWGRGGALYVWDGRDGRYVGDPYEDGLLRIAWRLPVPSLVVSAWIYGSTSLIGTSLFDGRVVPTLVHQGPDPSDLGIEPLVSQALPAERYRPVAAIAGPFVRVSGPGPCLTVRDAPGAGQMVGCFADGVLLQDLGDRTTSGGKTWAKVFSPAPIGDWAGQTGWADSEYLVPE